MCNGWTQERRQPIRNYPELVAVEASHRAWNGGWQSSVQLQRLQGGRRAALRAEIAAIRGIMADFENEVFC